MPEKSKQDIVLLIDSNALLHRAFHAYPQTLVTKQGELVNAVYGFTSLLLQSLEKFNPKYLVCVFDSHGPTFRHKRYKDYKANRKKTDAALVNQVDRVKEVVRTLNIPLLELQGFEADDIIGTLTKDGQLAGIEKIIVTGDRDLFQLVNGETKLYLSGSSFSKSQIYNTPDTEKKLGFKPEFLIDFKGLRGDSSDNIPGVKGVGDKTATNLIQTYGHLEDIYANLDEIKGAVKTKLEAEKEIAFLSRELATIDIHVDIDFTKEDAVLSDYDYGKAAKLFQDLEFKSLVKKLPVSSNNTIDDIFASQMTLMGEETKVQNTNDATKVDASNLKEFTKWVEGQDELIINTDTDYTNIFGDPECLIFAGDSRFWVINIKDFNKEELTEVIGLVNEKSIIGHQVKYVLHALSTLGGFDLDRAKIGFDTMVGAHILQMGSGKTDLPSLAFSYIGTVIDLNELETRERLIKETEIVKAVYKRQLAMFEEVENEGNWNLKKLAYELEFPIIPILTSMERLGIILDTEYMLSLKQDLSKMLSEVEAEIFAEVGHEFNIASPKQLGQVLFEEMGMPSGKKGKSGSYSTNERVLIKFRDTFPIVRNVLKYREIAKLQSTYTDALIEQVYEKTGRIHTNYNQAGTATGRLSSNNPNLQNIPISSELGQRIRKAFVSDKAKIFVSLDYSQQELRLLAHLSGEENLKQAFKESIDIHALTASKLFGKDINSISKTERRIGKTVNFGVVYGISAFGLSDRLDIHRGDAQSFIDTFFLSYPKVKEYFDKLKIEAEETGYVETIFGRKKNTNSLKNANWQLRSALEREIINFPLQGSAADMMKLAMLKADKLVKSKYSDMADILLQIHDELVFEVSNRNKEKLNAFIQDMRKTMLEVVELSVPMKVDAEIGNNLGAFEDF